MLHGRHVPSEVDFGAQTTGPVDSVSALEDRGFAIG